GANAMPNETASLPVYGMVCTTAPLAASITCNDWVDCPSFEARAKSPSGLSARPYGRSPSVTCLPAGITVQPIGVMPAPSPRGPATRTAAATAYAAPPRTHAPTATALNTQAREDPNTRTSPISPSSALRTPSPERLRGYEGDLFTWASR